MACRSCLAGLCASKRKWLLQSALPGTKSRIMRMVRGLWRSQRSEFPSGKPVRQIGAITVRLPGLRGRKRLALASVGSPGPKDGRFQGRWRGYGWLGKPSICTDWDKIQVLVTNFCRL